MNDFFAAMLKAAFLILGLLGVFALSLGVVLFLYPNVLIQLLRWGSVVTLVLGGAVLAGTSFFGYITARIDSKGKAKTP